MAKVVITSYLLFNYYIQNTYSNYSIDIVIIIFIANYYYQYCYCSLILEIKLGAVS